MNEEKEKMAKQMRVMQRREEEIVNRLDLDEIDLVTERLKIFSGMNSEMGSLHKDDEKPSKVPKLDFTRLHDL